MKEFHFKLTNQSEQYLKKIFAGIDNNEYIYQVQNDEVYLNNNFLFKKEIYTNKEFHEVIDNFEYYLVSIVIRLYENEEDYKRQKYTLELSVIDSIFVDILTNNTLLLKQLSKNAKIIENQT